MERLRQLMKDSGVAAPAPPKPSPPQKQQPTTRPPITEARPTSGPSGMARMGSGGAFAPGAGAGGRIITKDMLAKLEKRLIGKFGIERRVQAAQNRGATQGKPKYVSSPPSEASASTDRPQADFDFNFDADAHAHTSGSYVYTETDVGSRERQGLASGSAQNHIAEPEPELEPTLPDEDGSGVEEKGGSDLDDLDIDRSLEARFMEIKMSQGFVGVGMEESDSLYSVSESDASGETEDSGVYPDPHKYKEVEFGSALLGGGGEDSGEEGEEGAAIDVDGLVV